MASFDYNAPAELYSSRGSRRGRSAARYFRFDSAAEALRYAMEVLPAGMLGGTVMESSDTRYNSGQIRSLYLHADYPLPRPTPE